MNADLRKMAEEAGMLDFCDDMEGVSYVDSMPQIVEAFARLVAEDCAKILNDTDNSTDECLSPSVVFSRAISAIREKYGIT